jgi:hypothetical protein
MSSRWLARELTRNDKTLIGFWPFQNNLLDYSGLAAHGQSVGGTSSSVYPQQGYMFYRSGKRGVQVGQYNLDLFVDIGPVADYNFDYTNTFTISLWYYHTGLQTNTSGSLVSRLYQSSTGYELTISNDGSGNHSLTFGLYYQNYYSCTLTVPFYGATERWHHITVTYAGINSSAGIKIYINSKLEPNIGTVDNLSLSIANSDGRFQIGGGTNKLSSVTSCGLALARIWKRELSALEIGKLYYREIDLYRPRFKGSKPRASASIPLFIQGPRLLDTTIPLYISGPKPIANALPLILTGFASSGSNIPLYIYGDIKIDNSVPLVTSGIQKYNKGLNLFLSCATILFNTVYVPLVITGNAPGAQGLYKSMPLVISGIPYRSSLNLFLKGAEIDQTVRNMNLFIEGYTSYVPPTPTNDIGVNPTISAILQQQKNDFWKSVPPTYRNSIPLLIVGSGDPNALPPGTAYSSSLNLFIKRWPTAMVPLFVCCSSPVASLVPLFTQGASIKDNSVTLAMPNTIGAYNKPVPLYVSGY